MGMVQLFHHDKCMNTLYRDGKLKITVYADHNSPHFHVMTPDGESVVDLATMAEIQTGAPRKALAKALAWAVEHRAQLVAEWQRLNPE
jgi:hypothetical protein